MVERLINARILLLSSVFSFEKINAQIHSFFEIKAEHEKHRQ